MTAEIKILHIQEKLTKDKRVYKIVHVLIKIGNYEFVRKFYCFE